MTDLMQGNPLSVAQTMSSREIAELTGKRHDHVMTDCRKLAEFYGQTYSPEKSGELVKSVTYADSTGRTLPCFALSKQASLDLVTGYSLPHRHAVNKRWQELEDAARQPAIDPMQVLNDPAAMRGLLLTYSEKVLALEDRVSELTPKADALDRISTADGHLCITNVAKSLGLQRKSLIAFLSARRWIYRRAGGSSGWIAYQDKIQAGYLEHKVTTIQMPDGSDRLSEQVLVTPKGLAKLALIAGGVVKKAA